MNLVGYTATALSRNDIEDTPTNKNVVDFAIVELKDLQGNLVTIYDDAEGANPETQKICDTDGQVTFFAEVGDYVLEINGKAQRINLSSGLASFISTKTDESVQDFVDSFALKIFQSPTDGGLTEIQTRTVNGGEVYEVRKTSDDSLATIYSDAAEIAQNGTSNTSDSSGVIEFYIADGDYYIEVGGANVSFNTDSTCMRTYSSFSELVNTNDDLSNAERVKTYQYEANGYGGASYSKDGTTGTPNTGNAYKWYDVNGDGWLNDSFILRAEQWGLAGFNSAEKNTTALQSIFDFVSDFEIPVAFPSNYPYSEFQYNGPITLTSPSFDWTYQFIGQGFKFTKFRNMSTSGENGLVLTGESGTESVWTKFQGFLNSGNSLSGNGFDVSFAGRVNFNEVESSEHGGHGYYYFNSWAPDFIRCRGDRNKLSGAHLIGGINNKVNGARFEGGAFSSNGQDGIYLEAGIDDDTDSGALVNVGLSNNARYGIWSISPLVRIHECFPEFNRVAQIRIGDKLNGKVTAGVELVNNFLDGRNTAGDNYGGVILETTRGVVSRNNNFKNMESAHVVDSDSSKIEISHNRYSGTVVNVLDLNGTLFTDKLMDYNINVNETELNIAPHRNYNVMGGAAGVRENLIGPELNNSNPLCRWQLEGNTLFGVRQDGRLISEGVIQTATSPSVIQNKLEVFNAQGGSLGWIPIYQNF